MVPVRLRIPQILNQTWLERFVRGGTLTGQYLNCGCGTKDKRVVKQWLLGATEFRERNDSLQVCAPIILSALACKSAL